MRQSNVLHRHRHWTRALMGLSALVMSSLFVMSAPSGRRHDGPVREDAFDPAFWRKAFARPATIPAPPGNPTTPDKVALGRALFDDVRLSGTNGVACSSCHQPDLSYSDGVARRKGLAGELLARRTPPLWNLAWALTLFWDGRAASLEDQVHFPVENRHEMGGDLAQSADELSRDAGMRAGFAAAFPEDPTVKPENIAKALAAFERTLVSPETRFDRWVRGEDAALDAAELAGFNLFVGKAGCVACHNGWRFSDEAFHDIGVAGSNLDRGRGAVLGLPAADFAFKTPSLRERVWTAPYLHDGSLSSLEEIVDYYSGGVQVRPSLSSDLKPTLDLTNEERGQVVAFLATLSSEDPPRPVGSPSRIQVVGETQGVPPVSTTRVGQRERRFTPAAVTLQAGEALTVSNDDTRIHNIRVDDVRLRFSSEAQAPGDQVIITFPDPGEFDVICGIHPEMRLSVKVQQP